MSETIINIIKARLTEMGCTNISIKEGTDVVVARFDCEELTSFNKPIVGWLQMGIELNDEGDQDYKIVFIKFDRTFLSDPSNSATNVSNG